MENRNTMLRRHTIDAMLMHWFNTICWIILLSTGVGLINNPVLQPFGMWWVRIMHALLGGGAELLQFHIAVGAIWSMGFLIYGLARFKCITVPFIKEMLTFSPATDLGWLVKKPLSMIIGPKTMQRFGLKPVIPEQGFYNVGQKMFGISALFGGIIIAVTGWIMTFSQQGLTGQETVQWAILIHFLTAGLVFAGLLIHIYMAAIAKGETPAFISMFTGFVPADYAASHHKRWFDSFQKDREKEHPCGTSEKQREI